MTPGSERQKMMDAYSPAIYDDLLAQASQRDLFVRSHLALEAAGQSFTRAIAHGAPAEGLFVSGLHLDNVACRRLAMNNLRALREDAGLDVPDWFLWRLTLVALNLTTIASHASYLLEEENDLPYTVDGETVEQHNQARNARKSG